MYHHSISNDLLYIYRVAINVGAYGFMTQILRDGSKETSAIYSKNRAATLFQGMQYTVQQTTAQD